MKCPVQVNAPSPLHASRVMLVLVATVVDRQVLPFYPGDEGSLSFNSDIALDGSTPHIREIYFAGASNATYQGGDVVQVKLSNDVLVVFLANGVASFLCHAGLGSYSSVLFMPPALQPNGIWWRRKLRELVLDAISARHISFAWLSKLSQGEALTVPQEETSHSS